MLVTCLSVPVLVVMGPLTDRLGRKVGILWSLALTAAANAIFAAIQFIDTQQICKISLSLYYLPVATFGLSGGLFNFFMTVFSYVGDLSNADPASRLTRFTLAQQ